MYILDTDTLSLVFAAHPKVCSRRATVPAEEIGITVVTRIETLQGRFDFLLKAADRNQVLRAQLLLVKTEVQLNEIEMILPIDEGSAAVFEGLLADKKLRKIGRADLLIASIALAHRATVVTRNLRHFRQVPGLQVENWAD